jgi:UDP-2,3-diacylglucosamine pyrophosphatase LpxH
LYNTYRTWRGKKYFSLSKAIKAKVKQAVNFIGKYEQQLQNLAERRQCAGIICGHIHTPDDKMLGNIHYLNSGDWVESLTAIVEYEDGRLEVINYKQFCETLKILDAHHQKNLNYN